MATDDVVISIAPGKYTEALRLTGRRLSLIASGDPGSAVIDAESLGQPAISCEDSDITVQGLALRAGDTAAVSVVRNYPSPFPPNAPVAFINPATDAVIGTATIVSESPAFAQQQVTDPGLAVDAGDSLGQMDATPAEPLPHEATMDAMMAEFKAMSERVQAMEAELGQARGDYAAAAAKLGPPEVAIYAQAIYDKLTSFRAAHPDAPPGHFDAVIAKAQPLGAAAAATPRRMRCKSSTPP